MGANDPNTRVDIIPQATWEKVLEAAENPLPSVTKSDVGKVAVVNNKGVWVAGEAAGGGRFVVTITPELDTFKLDKTHSEIIGAISSGATVVAEFEADDVKYIMPMCCYEDGIGTAVCFADFMNAIAESNGILPFTELDGTMYYNPSW